MTQIGEQVKTDIAGGAHPTECPFCKEQHAMGNSCAEDDASEYSALSALEKASFKKVVNNDSTKLGKSALRELLSASMSAGKGRAAAKGITKPTRFRYKRRAGIRLTLEQKAFLEAAFLKPKKGKLAAALPPEPTCFVTVTVTAPMGLPLAAGSQLSLKVKPNPHHLIPGEASLVKCTNLMRWIFKKEGVVKQDVGYDVNDAKNGIWLPSWPRELPPGFAEWSSLSGDLKRDYAFATMEAYGLQYHDTHADYSAKVQEFLEKIADETNKFATEASCKKHASGPPYNPPFGLVDRLNGVSKRIVPYLMINGKRYRPLRTSNQVAAYWDDKQLGEDITISPDMSDMMDVE